MNTNSPAACRTSPSLFLLLQKGVHTVFPDHLQVLDHAHMVLGLIPLIQLLQPLAREPVACIAEPGCACLDDRTIFDDTAAAAFCFVCDIQLVSAAVAMAFLPLECMTKPAVHTAGGNEI
jgi:hypothetical protein